MRQGPRLEAPWAQAEAGQGGAQLHTGAAEALSAWLATEEGSDGEWVALSREAYCDLKARCVAAGLRTDDCLTKAAEQRKREAEERRRRKNRTFTGRGKNVVSVGRASGWPGSWTGTDA